ncbi:MAG: DUF6438 domain-containing protein [Hyphomonadaceae bacterium]
MVGITSSFTRIAAVAIAAVAAACSGGEVGVTQSQPGNPVIVLSEGDCAQTCPVYDMTLHPDGAYVLNGVKFVKTPGVTEGKLGAGAWKKAEETLNEAGFWSQPVDQTSMVSENCHSGTPTVQVTWRTPEGKQKTITYTAGCGGPEMRQAIVGLREAMGFGNLVWTEDRFAPDGSR